jgi:hypothetical protein
MTNAGGPVWGVGELDGQGDGGGGGQDEVPGTVASVKAA